MIYMKIKDFLLAMHHGKFQIERSSTEFQSIMEVSKLPWLQKKEYKERKEHFS